jgi:carboxyvinyl-carboxyphosphonate phosphorylmutase
MNCTDRRQRFQALLAARRGVHPASVFDPVSARIAEDLGYEAGMFAGSIAALAVLGAPDLVVLSVTELAQQAHRICRAGTLPLLVDGDHGYGNALNVMRTVEELETAGVAGVTIEDTLLPQSFGASGKNTLISVEEGAAKLRAALAARQDASFAIVGRTSAIGITGLDDALRRVTAYQQTGVDAIFLVGVKSWEQLDIIRGAIHLPLILGTAPAGLMDSARLADHGVSLCLQGHQPYAAAVQALYATMKALRDGAKPDALEGLASPDLMKRMSRAHDYQSRTEAFMGKPSA